MTKKLILKSAEVLTLKLNVFLIMTMHEIS